MGMSGYVMEKEDEAIRMTRAEAFEEAARVADRIRAEQADGRDSLLRDGKWAAADEIARQIRALT